MNHKNHSDLKSFACDFDCDGDYLRMCSIHHQYQFGILQSGLKYYIVRRSSPETDAEMRNEKMYATYAMLGYVMGWDGMGCDRMGSSSFV
jgi:hypothetical protein